MDHLAILNGFLSSAVTGSLYYTTTVLWTPSLIDSNMSADGHITCRCTSAEVYKRNHINKENCGCGASLLFHHVLVHVKLNQKLLVLKGTFDNKWLLCQLKKRLLGYYLLTTFFFTKELLPVCRKSLLNKTLGDLPASKKLWYI